MEQWGNQNVANVKTIATQMYCTAQRITSNACIVGVSAILRDVAGWLNQIDKAHRRLSGIDAGQVLMQSKMPKNLINISFSMLKTGTFNVLWTLARAIRL